MKKYGNVLVIMIFLYSLTSCLHRNSIYKAKIITDELLLDIKNYNYLNISKYYTDSFYNNITNEQWKNELKKINSELGPIMSYELIADEIENRIEYRVLIILVYKVKHTLHFSEHKFTLILENDNYKIIGHNIKLDAY